MTRKLVGLLVVAVLSMTSASALAQQSKPGKKSDDCAEQRKRTGQCELIIDGEEVGGELVGPGGDDLLARKVVIFTSLIRYRQTMVDKMVKNAEDF